MAWYKVGEVHTLTSVELSETSVPAAHLDPVEVSSPLNWVPVGRFHDVFLAKCGDSLLMVLEPGPYLFLEFRPYFAVV